MKNWIRMAARVCVMVIMMGSIACAEDVKWVNKNGNSWALYWRSNGNGNEISAFQVAVWRAPVTVTFYQEEGLCYEDSYTHYFDGRNGKEEEWGKYHIYYMVNGMLGSAEWDSTFKSQKFELYLNSTGVYRVWVVPYTAAEMTASWTLDTFIRWNKAPHWWTSCSSGGEICGAPYQIDTYGNYLRNGNSLVPLNTNGLYW